MNKLRDNVKERRKCEMCGRRLPVGNKHGAWCSRCHVEHRIGEPCPACAGLIHLPSDATELQVVSGLNWFTRSDL